MASSALVQAYTPAPHAPSLLPSASPDWMLAQSLTSASRRPLPADLIRAMWNPATCPLDILPYMAAGLGLEIWDETWPEAKKRDTVAAIWRLKRNKTKLKGIKGYLDLVGAGLVSAHRPRDRFWWAGGQSQAQRDATMAEMPRIRIFPFAPPAAASPAKAFWSGRQIRQFWRAGRAWVASDAVARHAARALYVDGASSTIVTLRGIDGPLDANLQVSLSAPASAAKLFWGARRAWGRAAWVPSDAADHVLAITPDATASSFAVPRGLVPVPVRPVRTSEAHTGSVAKMVWGRRRSAWGRAAWVASDAADHVYDEIVLFDPARAVPSRQPYSFWGATRFRRLPYTAEILVDVPATRPARQHGWGQPWGRNAWRASDPAPYWAAVGATRVARAVRDTVWIATALYEPIRFSSGLRFGDPGFSRFGSIRKIS